MLAACSWPATRDVQTADPYASQTAISGGGGILSRLSQGDDMFLQKLLLMFKVAKTATKLKSG